MSNASVGVDCSGISVKREPFKPLKITPLCVTDDDNLSQSPTQSVDLYSCVRELDDLENWKERTVVVTKRDHMEYIKFTREIIDNIVSSLVLDDGDKLGTGLQFKAPEHPPKQVTDCQSRNSMSNTSFDKLDGVFQSLNLNNSENTKCGTNVFDNSDENDKENIPGNIIKPNRITGKNHESPRKNKPLNVMNVANRSMQLMNESTSIYEQEVDDNQAMVTKCKIANSPGVNDKEYGIKLINDKEPMKSEPKSVYEQDIDEFQAMVTKSKIPNSPKIPNASPSLNQPKSIYEQEIDESEAMVTKSKIANSPLICNEESSNGMKETKSIHEQEIDEAQAMMTNSKIINSPQIPSVASSMNQPKSIYEQEIDESEAMVTKSKIANSPQVINDTKETKLIYEQGIDEAQTMVIKSKITNSPHIIEESSEKGKESKSIYEQEIDDSLAMVTKSKIANSPQVVDHEFYDITNEPKSIYEEDKPVKPVSIYEQEMDGSQAMITKSKVSNSPEIPNKVSSMNERMSIYEREIDDTEAMVTKSKIVNSPQIISKEPLFESEQMELKSIYEQEIDDSLGMVTKSKIANSPQIMNNDTVNREKEPKLIDEQEDAGAMIANSPQVINQETKRESMYEQVDDADAMITNSKIVNSPQVINQELLRKEKRESMYEQVDDADAMITKSKIINSPQVINQELLRKEKVRESMYEQVDDADAMITKSKIVNSPQVVNQGLLRTEKLRESMYEQVDDADAMITKSKIVNSPQVINQELLRKEKRESMYEQVDDADAMITKSKIVNSPQVINQELLRKEKQRESIYEHVDDADAIITKSKIVNSPQVINQEPVQKEKQQESIYEQVDDADAMITKSKIVNSPQVINQELLRTEKVRESMYEEGNDADAMITKSKSANSPQISIKDTSVESSSAYLVNLSHDSHLAIPGDNQLPPNAATLLDISNIDTGTKTAVMYPTELNLVEQSVSVSQFTWEQNSSVSRGRDSLGGNVPKKSNKSASYHPQQEDFGFGDDDFAPASEDFLCPMELDFLEKAGSSSMPTQSELARMSLYVKFDPLVGKSNATEPHFAIPRLPGADQLKTISESDEKCACDDGEGKEDDLIQMSTPTKKHPSVSLMKPTQLPLVKNLDDTLTGDITHIDLLALSPSESGSRETGAGDVSILGTRDDERELTFTQQDVNRITKAIELEWNSRMLVREKHLNNELAAIQKQKDKLQKEDNSMRRLVDDYEKKMVTMLDKKEKYTTATQTEMEDVICQRDQSLEDVRSTQISFLELKKRYEKLLACYEALKQNEVKVKAELQEKRAELKVSKETANKVLAEVEAKLEKVNMELDRVKKSAASEQARLETAIKMRQIEINTVQRNFNDKVMENKELITICDELIPKVGRT